MRHRHVTRLLVLAVIGSACGSGKSLDTDDSKKPAETRASDPNSPMPTTAASEQLMCSEHGVPEALCTKCNPDLAVVFQAKGDWCEEHGFPESFCPTCNPGATFPDVGPPVGAVADWCGGHDLPESKCTKCNPELIPDFKAAGDWCEEHGFPESACPHCNPQDPPTGAAEGSIESRVVRLSSDHLEASAGIRAVPARESTASEAVSCTASIAFDGDRMADIRAIVPGIVREVRVELGAEVKPGAPLFELESTRVGEIQGALQSARERARTAEANLKRQQKLLESEIASARQVELAEQELAAARARARSAEATLRMAGAARAAPSGRYLLRSPIAGTVVRRPAVVGLLASEETSLATVADTSMMWALCEVSEADASRIALGQPMKVSLDGTSKAIDGHITWIAAEVDPRTRTVSARAELANPEGQLRANQFARASIVTGASRSAVEVPRESVQRVGEQEVVFVRVASGVYEPRVVKRYGDGPFVQVEGRLARGDEVVTTGAVLLRTEVMPGSIGAGCCEVEAGGGD